MQKETVSVRVPATVGNFGGAGDTASLALEAALNVRVRRRSDGHVGIRYFGENGERVPRDRTNLVVRALEAALHYKQCEFTGADFEIYSSIPVAVGLGSSAAAVLAGLIAANILFGLELDEKALFELAEVFEKRGTSLRAAWLGGFVASVGNGSSAIEAPVTGTYQRTSVPENFVLSVVVPDRRRGSEIPGLEDALRHPTSGHVPVFVCGSGPAVGVFAARDAGAVARQIHDIFARHGVACNLAEFSPSSRGAREWNEACEDEGLPPIRGLSDSPIEYNSLTV